MMTHIFSRVSTIQIVFTFREHLMDTSSAHYLYSESFAILPSLRVMKTVCRRSIRDFQFSNDHKFAGYEHHRLDGKVAQDRL